MMKSRKPSKPFRSGKTITIAAANINRFPVTLNGMPLYRDDKPLMAGDLEPAQVVTVDMRGIFK